MTNTLYSGEITEYNLQELRSRFADFEDCFVSEVIFELSRGITISVKFCVHNDAEDKEIRQIYPMKIICYDVFNHRFDLNDFSGTIILSDGIDFGFFDQDIYINVDAEFETDKRCSEKNYFLDSSFFIACKQCRWERLF